MEGTDFHIPNTELEGSLELRVPSPQPARLAPVPSDTILFPRRMLYVHAAILFATALAAFGLGYLSGRGSGPAGGNSATQDENAVAQKRVPVEGKVLLAAAGGKKSGDADAAIIILPLNKTPSPRFPPDGFCPSDPPLSSVDRTSKRMAEFGGVSERADAGGDFSLFVPEPGSYRILIISHKSSRSDAGTPDTADLSILRIYFERPTDLLRSFKYRLMTKELKIGTAPIDVEFGE